MKKIIAIIAFAVLCPSMALRAGVDLNVFGGLTYVSMETVNSYIASAHAQGASDHKFGGGYMAGIDLGFEVLPGFSIGPRVEYIGAFDATASGTSYDMAHAYKYTYSASMLPVMFGVQEMFKDEDSPIIFGFGLYLGYGFAGFTEGTEDTLTGAGTSTRELLKRSGGGEVAEIFTRLDFKIKGNIAIDLLAGYRRANATDMKTTEASPGLPDVIGGVWMEDYSTAKVVSFNGWYINAGVVLGF